MPTVYNVAALFILIFWGCSEKETRQYDYHEDGTLRASYQMIDDSIILVKRYYKSGAINGIFTIVNGKFKGIHQVFYEKGSLLEQTRWLNDKKNGICYYYYPSGNVFQKINYENAIPTGLKYHYYDKPNSIVHYKTYNIKVNGSHYPNEIYEFNTEGALISTSPLVQINQKTDESNCLTKVEIHIKNPTFPRIMIYTGAFDAEYNLKDSTTLKVYDSEKTIANFYIRTKNEKDTLIRGLVKNYKFIKSEKPGYTKTASKYLYWKMVIKKCNGKTKLVKVKTGAISTDINSLFSMIGTECA